MLIQYLSILSIYYFLWENGYKILNQYRSALRAFKCRVAYSNACYDSILKTSRQGLHTLFCFTFTILYLRSMLR